MLGQHIYFHMMKGRQIHFSLSFSPKSIPTVRGCAYYNLALFKWLTTPREKRAPGDPKSKELETLEKEVIDLLRKAISSLEMLEIEDIEKYPRKETEKISPEEYQILDALLKRELKPEEMKSFQGDKIPLKNPLSSFACNMLAEVYLSMDKLDDATLWTQLALNTVLKGNKLNNFLRPLINFGVISMLKEKDDLAESVYAECMEKLSSQKVIIAFCFNSTRLDILTTTS
eukprot:TRINITY_DN2288_c0_g2_i7.p2 TRINITY_DN2288_c0_g2~~TRINITY_DN2288_c0_g2_i7.p2  ORF type:complete len:229 (+),score=39.60 TRINITY_DN2288_c0_g2_i7:646-1332(+)